MELTKRTPGIHSATVAAVLLASVALNVTPAYRVRAFAYGRNAAPAHELKVGTAVPSIEPKRLVGRQESISYGSTNQSTVLYVVAPGCIWCARNMDNFKTLLKREGDDYRFVALSLSDEGLAEYVQKNGLQLPVYSGPSNETKKGLQAIGGAADDCCIPRWASAAKPDRRLPRRAKVSGRSVFSCNAARPRCRARTEQCNKPGELTRTPKLSFSPVARRAWSEPVQIGLGAEVRRVWRDSSLTQRREFFACDPLFSLVITALSLS